MNHSFSKIYWYIGAFMSVLILVLGIGLLFTGTMEENLPAPNRNYLGGIFILYSIIRGTRVIQQRRKQKSDED